MVVNWIYIIKGLLFLGIFFHHFGLPEFPSFVSNLHLQMVMLPPPGAEIANVFFLLSGYLMCLSFMKYKSLTTGAVIRFYLKRLIKIILPYYFIVITGYYFLHNNDLHDGRQYLFHLLTFSANSHNAITVSGNPDWYTLTNSPLWFISVLIQFYIISPFLYMLLSRIKRSGTSVLFMIIGIGLAIRYGIYIYHQPWILENALWYIQLSVAANIVYFLSGMWIALIQKRNHIHLPPSVAVFSVLITLLWYYYASYISFHLQNHWLDIIFILPVCTVLCAYFFLLTCNDPAYSCLPIKTDILKPLSYLGKISLHAYLWHWLVILLVWKYVHIPLYMPSYPVYLTISMLFTILISVLSYRLFAPLTRKFT